MKFATLVLLSFKRPDFLRRTLESLWANTNYPYELIVVDDGSRDECWPYLFRLLYEKKVSTVIFNAGGNMGVGTGINRGFSIGKGDYLVKLDSDLEFKKGWLTEAVRILETFPEVWILGWFKYHHEPCRAEDKYIATWERNGIKVEIHEQFVSSAMILRRGTYEQYGPFVEHSTGYSEDVFFKKKCKEAGGLLGLTVEDYIHNFGFGIPYSTVVMPDYTTRPLHTQPLILGGEND